MKKKLKILEIDKKELETKLSKKLELKTSLSEKIENNKRKDFLEEKITEKDNILKEIEVLNYK